MAAEVERTVTVFRRGWWHSCTQHTSSAAHFTRILIGTNVRYSVLIARAIEVCRKTHAIPFRFCSIGCELGVTKRGDMNLSCQSDETEDSSSGTKSVVSSMPGKLQKTRDSGGPRIEVSVQDQNAADGCNTYSATAGATIPSTKPVFDHSNSRKMKGTPRRAPFFRSYYKKT